MFPPPKLHARSIAHKIPEAHGDSHNFGAQHKHPVLCSQSKRSKCVCMQQPQLEGSTGMTAKSVGMGEQKRNHSTVPVQDEIFERRQEQTNRSSTGKITPTTNMTLQTLLKPHHMVGVRPHHRHPSLSQLSTFLTRYKSIHISICRGRKMPLKSG